MTCAKRLRGIGNKSILVCFIQAESGWDHGPDCQGVNLVESGVSLGRTNDRLNAQPCFTLLCCQLCDIDPAVQISGIKNDLVAL